MVPGCFIPLLSGLTKGICLYIHVLLNPIGVIMLAFPHFACILLIISFSCVLSSTTTSLCSAYSDAKPQKRNSFFYTHN